MKKIKKGIPLIDQHDKNGFWGKFGGNFIPETLKKPVEDLTILFEKLRKDKKFIQGLIQLSVSFIHLRNGNMIGAKSLLRKSEEKFKAFSGIHRGINVNLLLYEIRKVGEHYNKMVDPKLFDWTLVPILR